MSEKMYLLTESELNDYLDMRLNYSKAMAEGNKIPDTECLVLEPIHIPDDEEIDKAIEFYKDKFYCSQATPGDFELMGESCIKWAINEILKTKRK